MYLQDTISQSHLKTVKKQQPQLSRSVIGNIENLSVPPMRLSDNLSYTPLFDGVETLCANSLADTLPEYYKKFSTQCSRSDAGTISFFTEREGRTQNYYSRSICVIYKIVNKDANIKANNWFDREYYHINFVASIIDTYVTRARTFYKGIDVAPQIPFYGDNAQNNKKVVQDIVKQLINKYPVNDLTEGRVEAVLYAMKLGAKNDVVHPAVYRPERSNVEQNSPGAENYLKSQEESEKKECTYFGVDICKIGNGVKYTIYGIAGLAAIYGGVKVYSLARTVKKTIKE